MFLGLNYRNLGETSVELFWDTKSIKCESVEVYKKYMGRKGGELSLGKKKVENTEFELVYSGDQASKCIVTNLACHSRYRFKLRIQGIQSSASISETLLDVTTHEENSSEIRLKTLISAMVSQDSMTVTDILNHWEILNLEATDKDGLTLLMIACRYLPRHPDITRILCSLGSDVNATTMAGKTPLMVACRIGNISSAKVLLEYGALVDSQDNGGSTALMWACDNGQEESVKLLISSGADINLRDKSGSSALSRLCWNPTCLFEIVQLLVENGANIDVLNSSGSSPLFLAVLANNETIKKYLLSKGAKSFNQDNSEKYIINELI